MTMQTQMNAATAARTYRDLERLSALETLKTLAQPEQVKIAALVDYLEQRGLWTQFSKITLGDLRETFQPNRTRKVPQEELTAMGTRRRRKKILADTDVETPEDAAVKVRKETSEPADGGMSSDEFSAMVLPFVEGNGDVTLDDLAEYTELDSKVLRYHMNALVKAGRLERLGSGRNAVYSSLG